MMDPSGRSDPAAGIASPADSDIRFVRRTLWVLMLIGLAWLLIELSGLLLLIFGAVLVAVVFDALAESIARVTRLPQGWALLVAVLVVFTVLALSGWLFGAQLLAQFAELRESLPRAWRGFESWLGDTRFGERLLASLRGWAPSGSGLMRDVGSAAVAAIGALGSLLLVVVAGVYLAAQPRTYRRGLLQLIPARSREAARASVATFGRALRSWLGAQLIAMALFSVVALGLLFGPLGVLLGAPLAIVLFVLVHELYVKRMLGGAAPAVQRND